MAFSCSASSRPATSWFGWTYDGKLLVAGRLLTVTGFPAPLGSQEAVCSVPKNCDCTVAIVLPSAERLMMGYEFVSLVIGRYSPCGYEITPICVRLKFDSRPLVTTRMPL